MESNVESNVEAFKEDLADLLKIHAIKPSEAIVIFQDAIFTTLLYMFDIEEEDVNGD